ncbi:hypothetical protein B6U67_04465 [Methanosarcinales archaeon ex4484_138]|nr:MAG: hypothetical protein B6U67_04465 [Methanosarcinales archaeon ex4484_138]
MDTTTACEAICTELRNTGFDEHGVLSTIPEAILIDVMLRHDWHASTRAEYFSRILVVYNHLLDHGYLEKVERGYRLTGEDIR